MKEGHGSPLFILIQYYLLLFHSICDPTRARSRRDARRAPGHILTPESPDIGPSAFGRESEHQPLKCPTVILRQGLHTSLTYNTGDRGRVLLNACAPY